MKRLKNVGEQPRLLIDLPQSDTGGLLKTGVFSLLFHIVLIVLLIFYLKTGIIKGGSSVYRVTIKPLSSQKNLTLSRPRDLPLPQPFVEKTQIQKEENRLKEEIKQSEPVKEERRLHQEDEQITTKPIPLPMAETSPLDTDSKMDKDQNLAIPLAPSLGEKNENTISELSSREGPGTGLGGPTSGGSIEGQEAGQEGSRWGGLGEGKGRGSSSWASSGKGSGMGSGVPGATGSGKGAGTGKWGRGGSGDGRSGVAAPKYGENPKPFYPLEARQKGYQGDVLVRVEVLPNGQVGQVEVERSSGYELLDQSALATVKKWRFIPARKGGVAIPCWVNIPIKFRLRDISF
jgi:TonB family protein